MNEKQANAIYDILEQECEAFKDERLEFVTCQTRNHITEWRFCGSLGFGGKFWRNNGRMYVTCYREDENPKRMKMIEKANKRLAELWISLKVVPIVPDDV
jgi:hypothetical protein